MVTIFPLPLLPILFCSSPVPTVAVNKLKDAFAKLGRKATGAKEGLKKLREQWDQISFGDRATVVGTLQSAASNIEKFVKGGDDPIGAVQGALNMIGQFSALAGPEGQIVSVALSFVSGILSLFGAGAKKQKSMGQIVREEIDEALAQYYEQSLSNQARGVASLFDLSKGYVDSLAQSGNETTVEQAALVERNVPLYIGLSFMGTLASEIQRLVSTNKENEAKKTLKYIELYTKIAVLKDVILQEMAFLLPIELEPNRRAMLKAQEILRGQQKKLIEFLRAGRVDTIVMNYFDPDVYMITDSYLTVVLKVPDYDRSLAGIWCLTPSITGRKPLPTTWRRQYSSLMKYRNAYVTIGDEGCFWKLIPHGNHLFTIVNTYKCPTYDLCGRYFSYDLLSGGGSRLTVDTEAVLWEIYGFNQKLEV